MRIAQRFLAKDFSGICFINLVDFDSLYGHRRDPAGYAAALSDFDAFIGGFMQKMSSADLLIITADHGCDPGFTKTTDHTREYVPFLAFGQKIAPANLGTRTSFADVAATVACLLGVDFVGDGEKIETE
jgi:phosphopentomutase